MAHRERASATPSPVAVFLTVGGLYVAQSVIGGLTMLGLPAVLRERGLPLDQIGLVYLTVLPWALKFLWSPYVERFRLPAAGRNRSSIIVVLGGVLCALALAALGILGPERLSLMLVCLVFIALVTSTVDIACDGYAVETLAKEHHGWGNAAQVGGAYVGSAIGAGLFLVFVDRLGWAPAVWIMAAIVLALGLPFLLGPGRRASSEVRGHTPSLAAALRRPEVRKGLLMAAIYVSAQKWGLAMLGPFLIDYGFSLADVGILNGLGSMLVGFGGALLGGLLVRLWGAGVVLVGALLLQVVMLGGFAFIASHGELPRSLVITIAVASSSGVMAVGFVALYAQFMGWADPRQAGVDFTLFQCMDSLISMAGGLGAGWIAEHFGYTAFFLSAAIVSTLAAPLLVLLVRQRRLPRQAVA
ncbi:MFS transporter [Ensifer adhaerens]|uniref:MFS transporter n=1 Tax=Ensifer adhaerens TaxID=106592 RepID=A0A0L8BKU6_ENSAD|nr:MFS transporter [Ensifer adhaerens]KOF15188.1 MFS transporter [Ensifer adhaerens]